MSEPSDIAQTSFRSAYCRKFGCRPERFAASVLRRCFPILVRIQGSIALAMNPKWFQRELALIDRLGEVTSESQLRQELEGYAYENARDKTFRTETLGLRMSRRRFVELLRRVRPKLEVSAGGGGQGGRGADRGAPAAAGQ